MGKTPCTNPAKVVRLYVRFPCRIVDQKHVRDLNPNIVTVILPRQPSRTWCIIDIPQGEIPALREIQINGKRLKIAKARKQDGKQKKNKNRTRQ